jgi:hypothetical protein
MEASMEYSVLSPRGDIDPIKTIGLQPRLSDLNNKTIGLFATFKKHWALIAEEIGRQLKERYPSAKFTSFRYTKDLNSYTQVAEVGKDPEVRPSFGKWLEGVDAVVSANGDAGSCTLYLTYNTTWVEQLGKPVVMTTNREFVNIMKSASQLRGVPAMRFVEINIPDLSIEPSLDQAVKELIPERVKAVLDQIIAGLTSPLTEIEKNPVTETEKLPRIVCKGNLDQINDFFYKRGWAYGMPVKPPTEEAVKEMLQGTDLPPDHVVAKIPPMMGKATVEKIAINAVMAGCLPTYMPVLIAAVEAMADPRMWIEAYTCSVASWAPLLMVNGPIRNDLQINCGAGLFSPYDRSNATIAHAIGLIVMNIAGIRKGIEDMGIFGHEGRFGMCIGENEEASPWEPLHEYYGFKRADSAVTLMWPNTRSLGMFGKDAGSILRGICDSIQGFGFDPGCAIIVCPETAQLLKNYGLSKKDFVSYLVEYARRPATEINIRWHIDNNHFPPTAPLPADPTRSVRKFWSPLHLPVVVAGLSYSAGIAIYGGGGDHGGPITKKIIVPKNWNQLLAKYK